jgi:flagellar FliL protein
MKKIIIIVVALLVLAGGGFAAWYFYFKGGGEAEAPAPEGEHGAGEHAAGAIFIAMEPFIIPVIHEDRVVKHMSLAVKLEVAGPAAEQKVKEFLPYIRDAFLTKLHTALSRNDVNQNYDASKLKRQLLAECEKVVGPGVVKDVLIENAVEKVNPP